jgi:pilus assembly protein Flp/PilA
MFSKFTAAWAWLRTRDERGAALVEYGLLVGLIAVVCVAGVTLLGTQIAAAFDAITAAL